MPLTVLYLGAQLALFRVLEDRVVAGVCALHCTVAAGLVKEGAVPARGRAEEQGRLLKLARAGVPHSLSSNTVPRSGSKGLFLKPVMGARGGQTICGTHSTSGLGGAGGGQVIGSDLGTRGAF